MRQHLSTACWVAALVGTLSCSGCGRRDPDTTEAQRARGESLIRQMSGRLASATSIAVRTSEEIARVTKNGERRVERLTREITMRRPDRLYSRVTGSRDLEVFYEGDRITAVSHREKVFGEFKTPPTIDETVHAIGERYGIALPIGDLLTANAYQSLMSSQTKGGWTGRESVDGTMCARLEWRHPNVNWTIWIPESGEPLPRRMHVVYAAKRGQPDARIDFKEWNLQPAITDATFARRVPDDYEGIAVIQRASALTDSSEPPAAATTGKR